MLGKVGWCGQAVACSAFFALTAVSTTPAHATERRVLFSIPEQPLASALIEFSRQSGALIVVDPALVQGLRSRALSGNHTPQRALQRLIGSSGLQVIKRPDGGFLIQRSVTVIKPITRRTAVPRVARPSRPRLPVQRPSIRQTAEDSLAIVVTARRREESLADVPLAMTVLGEGRIERLGLSNVTDLAKVVPGVELRDSASNKDRSILIRGVGTVSTSPGVEPSISIVVDDVALARPGQATIDLQDIERVEIIKGPQVTLFGKNASGGVINIVSKSPDDTFGVETSALLTSDREIRIGARVSGPIGDGSLKYSLSGMTKRFDGNQVNLTTGHRINGMSRDGVRAKLQTGMADSAQVSFSFDYLNTREDVPNGTYILSARSNPPGGNQVENPLLQAILTDGGIMPARGNTVVRSNFDSQVSDENFGATIRVDAAIGNATKLTSITAYRRWNNVQTQDYDGVDRMTSVQALGSQIAGDDLGSVKTTQFSQELRLTAELPGTGDFVAGLYFLDVDTNEQYRRRIVATTPLGVQAYEGQANFTVNSRNLAVFGEAHVQISDQMTALIGVRAVIDTLSYGHSRVSDVPASGLAGIRPNFASRGRTERTDWAGRIGLQYALAPSANLYWTVSRGYKGPAYSVSFNMVDASTQPLSPETSLAWEIGAKGTAFDGALIYNLAAFSTRFDGFQTNFPISFFGVTSTRLINAGSIRTRGVELDAQFRPTDHLYIQTSASLLDARVIHFNCPVGAICPSVDGSRLPFAPVFKANLDAFYRFPIKDSGSFDLGANLNFKSQTFFQLQQASQTAQPAYMVADAYLSFQTNNGNSLRISVRNLFNKSYSNYITEGNVSGTVHYVPRDNERYISMEVKIKI